MKIKLGDQLEYYDSDKQKWSHLFTMTDQDMIERTKIKLTQRWRQYRNYRVIRIVAESENNGED